MSPPKPGRSARPAKRKRNTFLLRFSYYIVKGFNIKIMAFRIFDLGKKESHLKVRFLFEIKATKIFHE